MSFAFFFPGQGSQSLGMMNGFAGNATVKATFDEASAALGQDLWAMINGEDTAPINETVNTQPLMLAAGVAAYRAYLEAGGKTPSVVAGHSLGEYTALVAAGALEFADAVKLVRLRAELMQNAVPQGEGAMAAILGLDDDVVRQVCTDAAQGEVVEAVNFNSPGQVVIAGGIAAVERAMNLAKEQGAKRALPLPVSVPSHCSLMKPAAEKLAEALKNVTVKQPQIRVIHNADVAAYDNADQIKDALVRQLYSPVRWTETVNALVSDGITQSAECGPGKVLAGLAKRINKEASCTALTDAAQVEAFIAAHNN
ncbi:ACP S-malonyltransferase [Neisseria animaloris]|uniref:ACP S-malonyltransferase n=1 Tax=Neisseria animaloris TaxID=326522 RepID=UPI000A19A7AF|nr:ACP S-malonyltransferase [Neisseria animaloris]OSI06977.1 [acyl-carrier-protein] S-malonyltransferase [Neisseria animaloris]VEH88180.1 ACP S-malonyltransferase [Neisseria animaloris]